MLLQSALKVGYLPRNNHTDSNREVDMDKEKCRQELAEHMAEYQGRITKVRPCSAKEAYLRSTHPTRKSRKRYGKWKMKRQAQVTVFSNGRFN